MVSGSAVLPAVVPTDAREGSRQVPRLGHFPCFEGLRALAALAVVAYHVITDAGPEGAGFLFTPGSVLDMGVSVFFVISGFLLYRPFVVAGAEQRPPVRLARFWWRRVVRIVPAYWAALTFMWVVGWVEVGDQPWRLYLFLQIYDPYTTLAGIVPAWSLNTEVSFYLFLPLWAALVHRVGRRWGGGLGVPLAGAGVLVVAGYVSRAVFSAADRVWAVSGTGEPVTMRQISFSWLPNTIDLFAIGMGLAVLSVWAARDAGLQRRLDRLAGTGAAWFAGAVAVWLTFAYVWGEPSLNGGYQGAYWQVRQAAFGLVGLCLLVPATFGDQARGVVRRGLQVRTVVWIGAVSYGLYLWHLDILQELPGWLDRPFADIPLVVLFGLTLGLGLVAAAASWYGLERPLQVLRPAHRVAAPAPPMRDREAALT
jgi:peptidoglycan/LPS O-acetylase OafA/YrhL